MLGAGIVAALLVAGTASAANASGGVEGGVMAARQVSQAESCTLPGGLGKITPEPTRRVSE